MSDDCLFCKIAAREIPADIVYEDDEVIAIKDINPQAPIHLLVIPKRHIDTVNDISENDQMLSGYMTLIGSRLAAENGIEESGYRLILNCNREGGQTVFHIHMHLLGGRQLTRLG
jgi:histidine triad (HIT) family protein